MLQGPVADVKGRTRSAVAILSFLPLSLVTVLVSDVQWDSAARPRGLEPLIMWGPPPTASRTLEFWFLSPVWPQNDGCPLSSMLVGCALLVLLPGLGAGTGRIGVGLCPVVSHMG